MIEDASQRGWEKPGQPGSAQEAGFKRDHLTTITLNCGVRLTVRREVAHIFKGFFDELEAETGYRLADGNADDWGYANRPNRNNPGVLSNHAYGLAVDGNAIHNPNGHRETNYPIDATHRLCQRWGLRWGEDYHGTPDPMHFEFMGTPADTANYPTGNAAQAADASQEDDDLYVFITDPAHNAAQVLAVAGHMFKIPDNQDSQDLRDAGAKFVKLEAPVFDKIFAVAE